MSAPLKVWKEVESEVIGKMRVSLCHNDLNRAESAVITAWPKCGTVIIREYLCEREARKEYVETINPDVTVNLDEL